MEALQSQTATFPSQCRPRPFYRVAQTRPCCLHPPGAPTHLPLSRPFCCRRTYLPRTLPEVTWWSWKYYDDIWRYGLWFPAKESSYHILMYRLPLLAAVPNMDLPVANTLQKQEMVSLLRQNSPTGTLWKQKPVHHLVRLEIITLNCAIIHSSSYMMLV